MLTIKDLSASKELDRAAMTDARGGFLPGIFNLPERIGDHRLCLRASHLPEFLDLSGDQAGEILGGLRNLGGDFSNPCFFNIAPADSVTLAPFDNQ